MIVGILGAGQLGRMLAEAGAPLGVTFRAIDPAADACAGQVCEHVKAGFDDRAALERFARGLDAVTYEWENVPVLAARVIEARVPWFFPSTRALELAQDRLTQKDFLSYLGIRVAPYAAIDSQEALEAAVRRLGLPALLKTRREGYDGKGQLRLKTSDDVAGAFARLGGRPAVLEKFVDFRRELSLVSVRSKSAELAFYPLAENVHREGILRTSVAPAPGLDSVLERRAREAATAILEKLDYVGALSIELFEVDGNLLVNEVATRVHNSGHWTLDGAETSQFENHLRAGLGMKLGSTRHRAPTVMVNLIGEMPPREKLEAVAGARVHLYGKTPKPGRKLGHVNAPLEAREALERLVESGPR